MHRSQVPADSGIVRKPPGYGPATRNAQQNILQGVVEEVLGVISECIQQAVHHRHCTVTCLHKARVKCACNGSWVVYV